MAEKSSEEKNIFAKNNYYIIFKRPLTNFSFVVKTDGLNIFLLYE